MHQRDEIFNGGDSDTGEIHAGVSRGSRVDSASELRLERSSLISFALLVESETGSGQPSEPIDAGSASTSQMGSFGKSGRRRLRRSNSSIARRYCRSAWAA